MCHGENNKHKYDPSKTVNKIKSSLPFSSEFNIFKDTSMFCSELMLLVHVDVINYQIDKN